MGGPNESQLSLVTYANIPQEIPISEFQSNDPIKADYYFHECLKSQERNLIQKSRLLIDLDRKKVIAYVSLHLARFGLKGIKKEPIYCPVLWISNFAIDVFYKGQGYEDILLSYVHEAARTIGKLAGCRFIMIEIRRDLQEKYLDPNFKDFLENNGFICFPYKIKDDKIVRRFRNQIFLEKMIFDLREDGKWT